jgi:hypothetical protein
MTDTSGTQPALPPIVSDNLGSIARFALAGAATWLVRKGVITNDDVAGFVSGGAGIALALATLGWAWWTNHRKAQKLVAAAATGDPTAPVNAPETKLAVAAAIADPDSPIAEKVAS